MVARKHGTTKTAFAGTARLFGSWSEIVCPREAYGLVQDFVVDLKRFALADTEVTEPVRINMVVAQPVTAVCSDRKRGNQRDVCRDAAESRACRAKQPKHEVIVIDCSDEFIVID